MANYKLFEAEYRLMDLLWNSEPIKSTTLVRLCEERFGWKKSTSFTQIKRMVERGFLKNEDSVLSSLVSRDMVEQYDSAEILEERFNGSLPRFVTAFLGSNRMTQEELDELKRILDEYSE